LERAARRIRILRDEIRDYYWNFKITPALVELRNLVTVAELIVTCAQLRHESRALHRTVDYPDLALDGPQDTVLRPE
jgi:L-aspartate oxidase